MFKTATATLVMSAACAVLAPPATAAQGGKPPTLDVRTVPRMAFSPATVLVIAELRNGDDLEEYYCPEIEWDFDDGTKSTHEADCPPYQPGVAIERRYSVEHVFRRAGNYHVTVSLRHNGKAFKKASGQVQVRPGASDPTEVHDF